MQGPSRLLAHRHVFLLPVVQRRTDGLCRRRPRWPRIKRTLDKRQTRPHKLVPYAQHLRHQRSPLHCTALPFFAALQFYHPPARYSVRQRTHGFAISFSQPSPKCRPDPLSHNPRPPHQLHLEHLTAAPVPPQSFPHNHPYTAWPISFPFFSTFNRLVHPPDPRLTWQPSLTSLPPL